ncbi:MAG: MotA/TolQ/ExbB proton channel family protein [Oceanococcaceae bacterium]
MNLIELAVRFFQNGGAFMYPIVVVLVLGLAISIERILFLRRTHASNRKLWAEVANDIGSGEFQAARSHVEQSSASLAAVLGFGLERSAAGAPRQDVELAMEEALMEVMPRLERRTPFIFVFANIATLLGLLGTIIGLIQGFTAVANVNPAEKANLLSASISVAMNTTAFGLMCAIPLLLAHAWLQARTTEVVDALEMTTVKFLNLIARDAR